MVAIKAEPHTEHIQTNNIEPSREQFLQTPKNEQMISKHSSSKIPISRPKNVPQNKSSNGDQLANKPKVNFSDYILSPTNVYKDEFKDESMSKFSFFNGSNHIGKKSDNISIDNRSSPIVKSEPIDKGLFAFNDINKKISKVIDVPDQTKDKRKKRTKLENGNINGKLKKTKIPQMTNKTNEKVVTFETEETIPKDPGNFKLVKELLYDREKIDIEEEDKLFKDLFEDADPNEELEYCKEVVQYPLEKWVQCGQNFCKEHEILIKELMKARLELSYKFEIITKTMNDRCEALIKQEDHLDGKLKQIKDIAKNMLDIL